MRKMISLMAVALLAGCQSSKTLVDNSVAAQMARSLPQGSVSANNAQATQAINAAQGLNNNQQVANILAGLAAASQAATAPPSTTKGVPNALTIGDLINAYNKGSQQSAAQNSPRSHQKIGFTQGIVGPGPVFGPTTNGQNLQVQMVPALTTPY